MHLDISETNADVGYILAEVRKQWGEEYRLVTFDGLELEDCEGNRGTCVCVCVFKRGIQKVLGWVMAFRCTPYQLFSRDALLIFNVKRWGSIFIELALETLVKNIQFYCWMSLFRSSGENLSRSSPLHRFRSL